MPATHKLQITHDEATGTTTAVHRCSVTMGNLAVSHSRDLELDESAAAALKAILDQNRALVEAEASDLAIRHAAAVSGKKQPGVIPLKVGGSVGPIGGSEVKKVE